MDQPTLSIVIADLQNGEGLVASLDSLAGQRELVSEVVVVTPMTEKPELKRRYPWVSWVYAEPPRLVPELWSLGMSRAGGDIVAITTSHFVPAADWVSAIREAHVRLACAAIGGRIDPPLGGSMANWATYFLRYSAYFAYDVEQPVGDLAGDNASYTRRALDSHSQFVRIGFWEQEFHRRLLANGECLVFSPRIRVRQVECFGFGGFLVQRFRHGQNFGRTRAARWHWTVRTVVVLASPLIPLVFLAKVVMRVLRSRQSPWRFVYSLPVLCCFLLAWALGEAYGYVFPNEKAQQRAEQLQEA